MGLPVLVQELGAVALGQIPQSHYAVNGVLSLDRLSRHVVNPALNKVYPEFLRDPMPARTTIQSNLPGFEIEVDAILAMGA